MGLGRLFPLALAAGLLYGAAPARAQQGLNSEAATGASEVQIKTEAGVLAGTLTLPAAAPKAALIMVTGSGPQNRDEEIFGHKPFKTLASELQRAGYATLRYDDRGVGESTGVFADALTADFMTDASAALRLLRDSVPEGTPVGILGHSEGGEIAYRLAGEADFLITLAAPALPGDSIILTQAEAMLLGAGLPPDQWAKMVPVLQHRYDLLKSDQSAMLLRPQLYADVVEKEPAAAMQPQVVAAQINQMLSPWYRDMLRYDPTADIAAVRVPWLALNGDRDCQVVPLNLDRIKALNPAADTRLLNRHNHLLQTCTSGSIAEYKQIAEDISPEALAVIVGWLDQLVVQPR